MRKFEDILRILSSILLGTLIRDFDSMSKNLKMYFEQRPHSLYVDEVADTTTVVLIALFFRNIHGSARYDSFCEETGYYPLFERNRIGRSATFALTLLALFFGPAHAGHRIATHLRMDQSVRMMALYLFLPLLVYAVWDVLLWCSDTGRKNRSDKLHMQDVIDHWVKIDALGLLIVILMGLCWLYLKLSEAAFPSELMAVFFILCAVSAISADYITNVDFYFPAKKKKSKPNPSIMLRNHGNRVWVHKVYASSNLRDVEPLD